MQYWLSLSSHTKGFLGVIIVEATDEHAALIRAIAIAPDTVAQACQIKGMELQEPYEPHWLNRLIVKPEIDTIAESTKKKVH